MIMNAKPIGNSKKTKGKTDWKRVSNLTDAEIAHAAASDPDAALTKAGDWKKARLVRYLAPRYSLSVEPEIFSWFQGHMSDYQARMNAVLRAFVDLHN